MAITGGYTLNHDSAFAGMVVDGQLNNIVSKTNLSQVTIPYGLGVVASGPDGMVPPASTNVAGDFIGVVVRELNRAYQASDAFGEPATYTGSVLTAGVIYVRVSTAVNARDPAFLNVGLATPGQFTNAAGTGATAAVQIPNAIFLTSASAGGLAKLSLKIGG